MANPSPMGPPLSPRETRRSGRRSAQSVSSSKSPESPVSESATQNQNQPPPRTSRENSGHRPSLSTSSSNGRSKRLKQEDIDDTVGDGTTPNGTTHAGATTNGRAKRKPKEKVALITTDVVVETAMNVLRGDVAVEPPAEPEEEPSVTRCVCGSTVDEEGEFMVQCETCEVWQHGLCVGYEDEGQVANIDYYCEQCRPDLHQDLIKQMGKKARQSSANSHHNPSVTSRLSRSHSPSHLLKPAKRRNTMNSRDAAFDESIKEIIEATAAEALAHDRGASAGRTVNGNGDVVDDTEIGPGGRKKRKRTEDDALPKKRTRSTSSASDHAVVGANPTTAGEEPPINGGAKSHSGSVPVSKGNSGRKPRGGRKPPPAADLVISIEGEDNARTTKPRAKPGPTPKRPPPSTSHASGSGNHEHGTRRNNNNGVNGVTSHGHAGGGGGSTTTTTAESSRAYKNSHAYVVSQQPLFTSWNLPDYLAHLEPMLPTDTPKPLEVRGSGVGPGGRESLERGLERGAKVKWPSKRMSVGDMNKRVRALVEWVGREQAGALDRGRRREALEKALKENVVAAAVRASAGAGADSEAMAVDPPVRSSNGVSCHLDPGGAASTMKQMEELMEELIGFQERFGPGAKFSNERGRRIASG